MKKKKIEKIPYLIAELADADRYELLAAAAVKIISGKRHLIVDIFKNTVDREFSARIVMNKTEYANYVKFIDTYYWEGKTVDSIRINICDRYYNLDKAHMDDDSIKKVRWFTQLQKRNYYGWQDCIRDHERSINYEKSRKADDKRINRLKDRIANTPELPLELYDWIETELFKRNNYIFYKRRGKYTDYTCSHCGNSYTYKNRNDEIYEEQFETIIDRPAHNTYARCERCECTGVYKAYGKQQMVQDNKHVYYIQKYKDKGIVARYIKITKNSYKDSKEIYKDVEVARMYIEPEDKLPQIDYSIISGWTGEQFWNDRQPYGMSNVRLYPALVYPESYENIKGTCIEHCAMDLYENDYDTLPVFEYIKAYWYNPQLEMIVKLGLRYIATMLVNRTFYLELHKGSSAAECLDIYKYRLKDLIKVHGDISIWEVLKAEKKLNRHYKDDEIEKLAVLNMKSYEIAKIEEIMTVRQYINRVEKYAKCEIGNYCSRAVDRVESIARRYMDYLDMKKTAGYDMTNTIYTFPRNLNEEHAAMIREQDKIKTEARIIEKNTKYSAIATKYKKISDRYSYIDEKYVIRPARDAGEIIAEGATLHHCVGASDTYMSKHATDKSYILFLRPIEDKMYPYITIEIQGYKIIQWYGAYDKKPDEDNIQRWLDNYTNMLRTGTLGKADIMAAG